MASLLLLLPAVVLLPPPQVIAGISGNAPPRKVGAAALRPMPLLLLPPMLLDQPGRLRPGHAFAPADLAGVHGEHVGEVARRGVVDGAGLRSRFLCLAHLTSKVPGHTQPVP